MSAMVASRSVVTISGSPYFMDTITDEAMTTRLGTQIQARSIHRRTSVSDSGKLRASHIFVEFESHHVVPFAIHRLAFDGCHTRPLVPRDPSYNRYLAVRAAQSPDTPSNPDLPYTANSNSNSPSESSAAAASTTSSHPGPSVPAPAIAPSITHPSKTREWRKRGQMRSGDKSGTITMRVKNEHIKATERDEAFNKKAEERLSNDERVLAEVAKGYETQIAALKSSIAEVDAEREALRNEDAQLDDAYVLAAQAQTAQTRNCVLTKTLVETTAMDREWEMLQREIVKEVSGFDALTEEIRALEAMFDSR
ncbi:hypothetical protein BOTBODRAFT_38690 [Botryobasidium botryosum FD-172 SS1]|uniref:Uncharacterized protein n=1 Tax=Botryobasidium botryosum (strain FD-172 SS1) TaxID=930990 RepID=A0A067M6U9_BOTB1|nr:hypothetical protein BOTBODRAFT_38690 [Botryobasidium botryosum FD-172 SS1]